jgi:hypothetical protein
MVHRVGRLLEVGFSGVVDVDEGLWIAIEHWKPAALNLHHDSVAPAKGVIHVG